MNVNVNGLLLQAAHVRAECDARGVARGARRAARQDAARVGAARRERATRRVRALPRRGRERGAAGAHAGRRRVPRAARARQRASAARRRRPALRRRRRSGQCATHYPPHSHSHSVPFSNSTDRPYSTVFAHVLLHRTVCAEVEPKKLHTSELVRRKQAGVPHALLTADEPRRLVPTRGRRLWPGVPSNQLPASETQAAATSTPLPLVDGGIERRERDHTTPASGRGGGAGSSVGSRSSSVLARGPERNASPGQAAAGGKKKAEKKERASPAPPQPSNLTPSVASQKTTLAHLMTVESRDSAFRVPIPCRAEPCASTPLVRIASIVLVLVLVCVHCTLYSLDNKLKSI